MITLEMVKNAEKAMNEGFAKKRILWNTIIATAEAEGRTHRGEYGSLEHDLTKEEQHAIVEMNNANGVLYETWKALRNQRAREQRKARLEARA